MLFPLLAALTMTACTGDYAQPPVVVPEGGIGSGDWNNPMSVYQASLGSVSKNDNGTERTDNWVTGYIVGWVDVNITNVMKEETCKFTTPATVATNIVLAADPKETDWTKCIPVQLPSGSVRSALNLLDHPENAGVQVTIYGTTGSKYCSAYGVRSVTNYKWGETGVYTPKTIFKAPFTNKDWAGFSIDNGGHAEMWTLDNRFGLVAKGRFSNVNYDCKGSAVSPVIDLKGAEKPVLMFMWAGNYFTNVTNFKKLVKVCLRTPEGEWQDADIPTWAAGNSWDFVSTGRIDLSAFKDGKVQIGFFYESTKSISGTLEIRDVQVLDATVLDNAPAE